MSVTPSIHPLRALLAAVLVLACTAELSAQAVSRADFRIGFSKGLELGDQKLMDQWMKKIEGSTHAALYLEELAVEQRAGDAKNEAKIAALVSSWERCFEGGGTLRRVQRWVDAMETSNYALLQKGRTSAAQLWKTFSEMPEPKREELIEVMRGFGQLAANAQSLGHMMETADLWGLAGVAGSKIKPRDKTIEDRREILAASEAFLMARQSWEFTFDHYYVGSAQFVKDEKARLAEDEKKADKRRDEGYGDNAKGIDSLVMAGVAEEKIVLQYEMLKDFDELDYGPKNGPVPPLWWNQTLGKEGDARKLDWFRRREIYLARLSATKFGISFAADDLKNAFEVQVSNRPKPSTFWLDADKKVAYAMFFWAGSDREKIGEAECNLSFTTEVAPIYYRSAASWQGTVGKDEVRLFDDNCNGQPGDGDVWDPPLKVATLGDYDGDGTAVPLLDSMQIGKGPRRPFSEFVKLTSGWVHIRRTQPDQVAVRPLNPEYVPIGKAKLVWKGPKSSAPSQLVVQGRGDFKTAYFDLAGGKEVELPAGDWTVIFGRIVVGKGARTQLATIYGGESKAFTVEAGKTAELSMGAPFTLAFTRRGDADVKLDALKVFIQESSGCLLTELHGMALAPEVFAAKADDGKGQKAVAKFVTFSDPELVNMAGKTHGKLGTLNALYPMPQGYKDGPLTLTVPMPGDGMKVSLQMKKHPVFGVLLPHWQ